MRGVLVYSLRNAQIFGVVQLPMRSSVCWPLLVIVMGYGAAAMAQQPYADYRFREPSVEMERPDQGSGAMNYRWRPQESDNSERQTEVPPERAPRREAYGSSGTDYMDEPFGLPRGTYRRIEERHTIVPHDEGFRFRPLKPEEQARVKERNQRDRQTNPGGSGIDRRWGDPRFDGMPSTPAFRPDKRLDGGARESRGRYTYPENRQLQQFRPN